jgi:hypothetical protein
MGWAIGSIFRISFCRVFDVSCNVVVALSDIYSFSQLGMSGEHGILCM